MKGHSTEICFWFCHTSEQYGKTVGLRRLVRTLRFFLSNVPSCFPPWLAQVEANLVTRQRSSFQRMTCFPLWLAQVESKNTIFREGRYLVSKFASTWTSQGGKPEHNLSGGALSGFQICSHLDEPRWKARTQSFGRSVVWFPNLLPPGRAKVESKNTIFREGRYLVSKIASTWTSQGGKLVNQPLRESRHFRKPSIVQGVQTNPRDSTEIGFWILFN